LLKGASETRKKKETSYVKKLDSISFSLLSGGAVRVRGYRVVCASRELRISSRAS